MDTQYLYGFLLALILSLILIPLLIQNSARLGLIDDSAGSNRKLHSGIIPRSGGIGIILAASLAVFAVLPADKSPLGFLLSCLVIIGFGLLDDLVELKPLQKIGGQAIGILIAMANGMVISDFPLIPDVPLWFCYITTFVFVLGVVNGVNFSDGMDGLAAGITLMALALIFILAVDTGNSPAATIALAVSASLLGFLRFNTHPARIFMGDAGSQFLGFSLAWLSISVSQGSGSEITRLMPLLILGIPVMDILQVIPVRIKKKLPLPGPDKQHFHHQIAKLGFEQYEVVALIYVLQATLLVGAYTLRFYDDYIVIASYVVFVAVVLGTLYIANTRDWRIRSADQMSGYNRRNNFFRWLGELHPYTGLFFGSVLALFLSYAALLGTALPKTSVYGCLGWALLLLFAKLLVDKRWSLVIGRLSSYTAAIILVWGLTQSTSSQGLQLSVDAFLAVLAILLVLGIRITRREYFGLTTEDLLVALFFITLTPLLLVEFGQNSMVVRLVLRICVLFYACEYVLARGDRAKNRLTYASLFALFLTGIHL